MRRLSTLSVAIALDLVADRQLEFSASDVFEDEAGSPSDTYHLQLLLSRDLGLDLLHV